MKYIITEGRMINLVDQIIKSVYPKFGNGECYIENMGNSDDPVIHYFDDKLYAKYHEWTQQLELRRDLLYTLENFLGEDNLGYVIQWFNEKYNKDAISITS
jgi:hypothetical protein